MAATSAFITPTSVRAAHRQQVAAEEASISRHGQIREALGRHDGKKITRRLNVDLGKIGAQLSFRYGMIYVSFRKDSASYDTFDHLLAYDSDPTVNLTKFEELDACHGQAAALRREELKDYLASEKPEKAAQAFEAFKVAAVAFKMAMKENGCYEVTEAAKATMHQLFHWRIS